MLIAYFLSTTVIDTNIIMITEEASQAVRAVVLASLLYSFVLSFLVIRSPFHGIKLVGRLIIIHFGVETFMAQIETLYFNSSVQMGLLELVDIVLMGAVRAIIFAPLAVLIFGKMKGSALLDEKEKISVKANWNIPLLKLAVFYVVVYFLFGYFVAWQWEETRIYYTGSDAIKPFFSHFWDLFNKEDSLIIPFQLARGVMWSFLALLIVRMLGTKRLEASLAVALTFLILFGLLIGIFPNPYMPDAVA